MIRADAPLNVLFHLEGPTADDSAVTPDMARTALAAVREALAHPSLSSAVLRVLDVGPGVLAELGRALAAPVSEIIVTAWNKRKEIQQYAATAQDAGNESHSVWLCEHELTETVKPVVEVRYAGGTIAKLEFVAEATLTFHGLILVIRRGRIMEVQLGSVSAGVSLSVAGAKLIAKDSRDYDFTGSVSLGEGIKIPA